MFVDQGVSSATNFLATVLVARAVSDSLFGSFSIALVTYRLVVSTSRALISQPLAIRVSARSDQLAEVRAAAGAAIVCGTASGVAIVLVGVAIGGAAGVVLVVIGVLMPALVLQDTWRYALFTIGQPRRALVNDLVWAVIQVGLLAIVLRSADRTLGTVVLIIGAWGVGAVAAAVLGARQARVGPALGQAGAYLRRHFALGWRFSVEALSISGASQLTMVAVAAMVSTAGVGAIRGGATLFGPLTVVFMGVIAAGIPEGARLMARAPHRLAPMVVAVSAVMVGLAVSWGAMLLALPAGWGRGLLGETWTAAREVILPFTVANTGVAMASGALLGLRIVAAASATLRLRLLVGVVTILAGVAGARLAGPRGAVWGIALGSWTTAVGSWWSFGRYRRTHPRSFRRPPPDDRSDAGQALGAW